MKNAKHTPGRWAVSSDRAAKDWVVSGQNLVAVAGGESSAQIQANALLIAAAPELLSACLEFIECGPNAGHNGNLIDQMQIAIAIAKATGGTK